MEVGNREAIPCCRIRSLAQAMDRGKDIRLDQSQSPFGARLRTLCHNRRCLHPPRNDPHHAKATCCKRLVLNPIFSDGLLTSKSSVFGTLGRRFPRQALGSDKPSPGRSVKLQTPIAAPSLFRACAALRLASNNPLQALAALRPRSAQNTRWQAPRSVPPIACSLQRSASHWPAASFLPTVGC